jgi:hypothetical protein
VSALAPDGLSLGWGKDTWRGRVAVTFDHEGASYAIRVPTDEERGHGARDRVCLVEVATGEALTHWNPAGFCAEHAVELAAKARLLEHAGRVIAREVRT